MHAAKILGGDESPPPSRLQRANRVDPSGVNFAVAGSGVFDGEATSLRRQVDQLASLVNSGIVEARDLEQSVALVAVSAGHDYSGIITFTFETSSNDVSCYLIITNHALHIYIYKIDLMRIIYINLRIYADEGLDRTGD